MTDEKTTGEREAEKEIVIDQIRKARFGILFTLRDSDKQVLIEQINFGYAQLNEFTKLTSEAINKLKQIITDSINAEIDRSCPTCDRTNPYRYAG
jgi:hypothetical protein